MLKQVSVLHSSWQLHDIPLYACTTFCIHSSADGHSDSISRFWLLWTPYCVHTCACVDVSVFNFFDYILRIGIIQWYCNSMSTFWETAKLVSAVIEQLYIPTSNIQGFQFLHVFVNMLSSHLYFLLLIMAILVMCEMIFHCSFHLYFINDWRC